MNENQVVLVDLDQESHSLFFELNCEESFMWETIFPVVKKVSRKLFSMTSLHETFSPLHNCHAILEIHLKESLLLEEVSEEILGLTQESN